jgi:hypothetical protein
MVDGRAGVGSEIIEGEPGVIGLGHYVTADAELQRYGGWHGVNIVLIPPVTLNLEGIFPQEFTGNI